jgi:SRSO17 transposase
METIETAPVMELRPQDIDTLVDALQDSHAIYSPLFQRREQRAWSADSLHGLLLEMPRTSVEPMVLALKGADTTAVRAMQQFVGAGAWQAPLILRRHWHAVDGTLGEEDGVLTLDGSEFLKQGKASVGVKRQDCGEVGKRAHGQAGVLLGSASSLGSTLVDRRLYLPQEWAADEACAARRRQGGVPQDIKCQTTPELGWEMIRAVRDEQTLRGRWRTCDEAFGRDTAFLDHVAGSGLWYFAEVPHDTRVWQRRPRTALPAWSGRGRRPRHRHLRTGAPVAEVVTAWAKTVPAEQWQRRAITEGSKGPRVADGAVVRRVAVREGWPGPDVWLGCRRHGETGERKTYLGNAPADLSLETLARLSGMRWPIETCFEPGKQYLGMGDDAVRSWRGWHHHMTLCILAHFFLVRQQQRVKKRSGPDRAARASAVDGRATQARCRCRLGT